MATRGMMPYRLVTCGLVSSAAGSDHTEDHAKPDPERKGAEHMTPIVRRRIGAAAGVVIAYISAAIGIWPVYHLWAILVAVTGTSAALYAELQTKRWIAASAILVILGTLLYELVGPVRPEDAETHGFLLPAKDATPMTPCTPDSHRHQGWFFVNIAGEGVYTINPTHRLVALSVGDRPTVVMERSDKGLLIDVDMFNASGALAVRIEKNEWTTNSSQIFHATRPDDSTLRVVGMQGEELLWIRYMNPNTVKIRGTFYKVGDPEPVVITDDSLAVGNMQLFIPGIPQGVTALSCFVIGTQDFRDPILSFK